MKRKQRKPLEISPPPLILAAQGRHRHLNDIQRESRQLTALHEAAHVVCAINCGVGVSKVFVRVPGRTPRNCPGHRGGDGHTWPVGQTERQDALISAVAVLAEVAINPTQWETRAASDIEDLEKWSNTLTVPRRPELQKLMDEARSIVANNWQAIDGVAAALLDLGDATGVVKQHSCAAIDAWVKSEKWKQRVPSADLPAGYKQ